MAFQYKLEKVNKMGENHEKYGQTYWAEPEGQDEKPIKFNSYDLTIGDGATITADERAEKKAEKSGNLYYALRKVKVIDNPNSVEAPEAKPEQASQSVSTSLDEKLDTIIRLLQKLAGEEPEQAPQPKEDILPTELEGSQPVDLSDVPF